MPLSNPSPGGRGLLAPGVPLLDIFINGIVQHVVFRAWSLGLSTKFSVSFHIIACWHLIPKAEECPPCGQTMGAYLPPGQGPPGLSPTGCLEGPLFRKPSLIPSFSSPVSVLTSSPPPHPALCLCVHETLLPCPRGRGGCSDTRPPRAQQLGWGLSPLSAPPATFQCVPVPLRHHPPEPGADEPSPGQPGARPAAGYSGEVGLRGCRAGGPPGSRVQALHCPPRPPCPRQETIEQLLSNMLEGEQSQSVIVSGVQVLLTLLEPRRPR